MKKFFLPLILVAIFGGLFSACNNGNYNANPTSGYNTNTNSLDSKSPKFSCGIGGYYFTTGIVRTVDTTIYDTISIGTMKVDTFKVLEIVATPEYPDTSHTTVILGINNYHGVGTYDMTAQSPTDTLLSYGSFYYNGVYGVGISNGVINVSASKSRLQGTFSFTPISGDGYVITSGSFDLPTP